MSAINRILIAGVGNELLADDGVGIHAIRELRKDPIPGVSLVEIGTAILHGLHFLESVDRVLVIDAARGGRPPGSIYLFEAGGGVNDSPVHSIHALGLREAAAFLMAGKTPAITVLGVEPEALDYRMTLSESVQAALPQVVALARGTVSAWMRDALGGTDGALRAA
jgi:hydrogenase maturation protease